MAFDIVAGESLLDCGDLVEFWREFASSVNQRSELNKLLVRAALMTADMLDGVAENFDDILDDIDDSDIDRSSKVRVFRERFNA